MAALPRSVLVLLLVAGAVPVTGAASCGGGGPAPAVSSSHGSGASTASTASSGSGSGGHGGAGSGGSTLAGFVGSGGGATTGLPCGGPPPSDAGSDAATGCEDLDGGVTWSTVSAVLVGCVGETCHATAWTQPSLVDVVAYECCDRRFLVAPGNPNGSYLVDKLAGTNMCMPSRMPASGPPYLSDADILTVRRWICAGAPP